MELERLIQEIQGCRICEANLPLGPRPVLRATRNAKIALIGQAPGTKVHASGIPWDDVSGNRLRDWLGVSKEYFYDSGVFAIIPMGFCFPGTGKSGDLPPRPECAPLWHERLFKEIPGIQITLLIGAYAQKAYLGARRKKNLTETVRNWQEYHPEFFPIVHPSPRNKIWQKRNPWFETLVLPEIKDIIAGIV